MELTDPNLKMGSVIQAVYDGQLCLAGLIPQHTEPVEEERTSRRGNKFTVLKACDGFWLPNAAIGRGESACPGSYTITFSAETFKNVPNTI